MNWVKDYRKNKDLLEIKTLKKNIENNYYQIGKILKQSKENNTLDIEKVEEYGVSKKQTENLIKVIDLIEKYDIEYKGVSLSKLTLLAKIKNENKIKEILPKLNTMNVAELKNYIITKKEERKIYKSFIFDEETEFLFQESSKIIKYLSLSSKMNNSEIIKSILQEFYSSNLKYLPES